MMTKLFTILFFCVSCTGGICQLRVGVITDLPKSLPVAILIDSLLAEIDNTTGFNDKVVAPDELLFYEAADEAAIISAYRGTNADLIITIGGVPTRAIASLPRLDIPVIGLGVVDPYLQNIPYRNGKSGKDNFTYLLTARNFVSEIESFKKLHDFNTLTVVNAPGFSKSIDEAKRAELLDSLENSLNITIKVVQAEEEVSATIQAIGTPEAVYLSSLPAKSKSYITRLSNYFIEQKIPAFSSSRQHVDEGILGAASGNNNLQQVTRRIAVVADEILSGINAAENFVALNLGEDIFLNVETARKIEFTLPFEVILTVNLVGETKTKAGGYSFAEIAENALENNFSIEISYKDIDLSKLDIKSSRSIILPSLSTGLTAVQINEERANAAINSPEKSLSLDFTLSQVIYSEEALAALKISQYLRNAQEYGTAADVLDVLLDTYSAYLNVLTAKTNFTIQRQNLENTKTNLELAAIRVDLGAANNSDRFRWESEVANATQSLIEAQTALLTARLQLNNLLANSLEDDFTIEDIGLEDEMYRRFREGPLAGLITTPENLKLASDFLYQESLKQNPNKKELLENIKATERQLQQNKRLFFVPTISLQAQASEILARGGEGSEVSEPEPGMPAFGTGLQDNSWSAAVNLTFPLFTGLSRKVNKQRSQVQLEQLAFSNQALDQALELGIRSASINLLRATTNLRYSRVAAENAEKNFQLVQNYYREGAVNITQLIDAQEASLGANLQRAVAIYEFILANLQLEYSIGQFSMFLTEEQLTDFNTRFLEFIAEN